MTAILLALAPVAIKLFDLFLSKIKADKEARKAYLKLVNSLGNQGKISVSLREDYERQLEELERAEKEGSTSDK